MTECPASYKMPSQLYMLLIIILILSQDKGFIQNIQGVALGSVPWYKERMLQKTSLGKLESVSPCQADSIQISHIPSN